MHLLDTQSTPFINDYVDLHLCCSLTGPAGNLLSAIARNRLLVPIVRVSARLAGDELGEQLAKQVEVSAHARPQTQPSLGQRTYHTPKEGLHCIQQVASSLRRRVQSLLCEATSGSYFR